MSSKKLGNFTVAPWEIRSCRTSFSTTLQNTEVSTAPSHKKEHIGLGDDAEGAVGKADARPFYNLQTKVALTPAALFNTSDYKLLREFL